jgi:thiamine biosynthesis lipoprotein
LAAIVPGKAPSPAPASPEASTLPPGMIRAQFRAMGTTVSLLIPEAHAADGAEAVRTLFADWEQTLSRFLPDSELACLNRHAGEPVTVGPLLFTVLKAALAAARATSGLYDPTLLQQMIQLGYDRPFDELPATMPAATRPQPPGGGWRAIQLDPARRCITLPAGVGIDLGGIAKGMAVDAALARLDQMGISPALVNAGGDLAVRGVPAALGQWPIAVSGRGHSWVIPFHHGALATSGVAHRRWQQGTYIRHHLVDPRTGAPAQSGLWSVTVAAARCMQAEVAAKVAFLLGPDQGRSFLTTHSLAGLLVREDGTWTPAGPWPTTAMQEMEGD